MSSGLVTTEGLPARVLSKKVVIRKKEGCYFWYLSTDVNAFHGRGVVVNASTKYEIYAQIADVDSPTPERRRQLTRMYDLAGDMPEVTFSNSSIVLVQSFPMHPDQDKMAWVMVIYATDSTDSVIATVTASRHVTILECSVKDTAVVFSMAKFRRSLGTNLQNSTEFGQALKTLSFTPSALFYSASPCDPTSAVMLFRSTTLPTSSEFNFGSLAIVTEDLFTSETRLVELLPASGSEPGAGAEVYVVRLLRDRIFLVTSRGLLISDGFTASSMQQYTFSYLLTGVDHIDGPWDGSNRLSASAVAVHAPTTCLWLMKEDTSEFLFLAYSSSDSDPRFRAVVYTDHVNAPGDVTTWYTFVIPAELEAYLPTDYTIAGISHDRDRQRNIYLITATNGTSGIVLIHDDDDSNKANGTVVLGFQFPHSIILHYLILHADGVFLVAYGPGGVWLSIDGGIGFEVQVPPLDPAEGRIQNFVHAQARTSFSFMTEAGSVFYSIIGVSDVVRITSSLGPAPPEHGACCKLTSVALDMDGNLALLEVSSPPGGVYSDSDSDYPMGLLQDRSGTIRLPIVYSSSLPILHAIDTSDTEVVFDIHPSWIDGNIHLYPAGQYSLKWSGNVASGMPSLDDSSDSVPDDYVPASMASPRFQEIHLSRVLTLADGGSVIIGSIDLSSGVAYGAVSSDSGSGLASRPSSLSPALLSDLLFLGPCKTPGSMVLATLPNALSSAQVGWVFSDVGTTLFANFGSFRINRFINATHIELMVVSPPWEDICSTVQPSGSWSLVDLRAFREEASVNEQQVLTVSAVDASSSLATVTLSSGFKTFDASDEGKVIAAGGGWGVLVSMENVNTVKLAFSFEVIPAGQYLVGQWSMYAPAQGFDYSALPHQHRAKSWSLVPAECPVSLFYASPSGAIYVDVGESQQLMMFRSSQSWVRSFMSFSNASVFLFKGTTNQLYDSNGLYGEQLTLTVSKNTMGATHLLLAPDRSSLLCQNVSHRIFLVSGCPPTKAVQPKPFLTISQFLAGSSSLYNLPSNYRPPSAQGRGIPTSDNIYNADPSRPRYFDVYKVSKESGRYKQCQGKKSRSECGCSDLLRYYQRESSSDCIDMVWKVAFSDTFIPSFQIVNADENEDPIDLDLSYYLTEVNGRTEFKPASGTADDNSVDPRHRQYNADLLLDPTQGMGLTFTGLELFHFRVQVAGYTHCDLSTEILIYVYGSQLDRTMGWVAISITAVIISLGLLTVYLIHVRRQGIKFS